MLQNQLCCGYRTHTIGDELSAYKVQGKKNHVLLEANSKLNLSSIHVFYLGFKHILKVYGYRRILYRLILPSPHHETRLQGPDCSEIYL